MYLQVPSASMYSVLVVDGIRLRTRYVGMEYCTPIHDYLVVLPVGWRTCMYASEMVATTNRSLGGRHDPRPEPDSEEAGGLEAGERSSSPLTGNRRNEVTAVFTCARAHVGAIGVARRAVTRSISSAAFTVGGQHGVVPLPRRACRRPSRHGARARPTWPRVRAQRMCACLPVSVALPSKSNCKRCTARLSTRRCQSSEYNQAALFLHQRLLLNVTYTCKLTSGNIHFLALNLL
jgi:hypothetical protein